MTRATGGRSIRDMVLTMIPLALIVLAVAGLAGMCAFSPGQPETDRGTAPTVDAHAELARAARSVPFAVRDPGVPAGWRANSFGLRPIGEQMSDPRAVRVGWLLPAGGYLRLSQSDATEVELLRFETQQRRPQASGSIDVDGVTWVRYPSVRDEKALVADVSGVRLLITGSGSEPDMRALAAAVLAAAPLPR